MKEPVDKRIPWSVGEWVGNVAHEALGDGADVGPRAAADEAVNDAWGQTRLAFRRPHVRRNIALCHGVPNVARPNQRIVRGVHGGHINDTSE